MVNKKTDKRKIFIYSRKSKFTGKGESTHNQIEACKKKIAFTFPDVDFLNDIVIFEDEGFSGYTTNRPDYQNMIKRIKNNEAKSIAFYKLDRISRNVSDFSTLVMELDQYNVSFLSATENIENITPTGRAMMFMTSVFAQLERDTAAERIRDNMMELATTGRWLGGCPPTGFKSAQIQTITVDGKARKLFKLSPVDDEMRIVTTLFHKMKELKSQTKLETYTLQNNIKTRNGKNHTRWGLKNILTNPVYAVADEDVFTYFKKIGAFDGYEVEDLKALQKQFDGIHGLMVYNKTENKKTYTEKKDISEWVIAVGKHKGVIKGKDWVYVQELLRQNSDMKYRKPNASNCLLSGILRCGHCGSFMRAKMKNKTIDDLGRRRFDYMCELKERSKKANCDCKNIYGLEADDLVMAEIKKIAVPTSAFYLAIKKISADIFDKEDKDYQEIKTLKSTLTKNENNIASLLDKIKYVDLELLDDLSNEIKKLKASNSKIEKQLKTLTNNNYDQINDKDTADLLLSVLDTYFDSFDTLDLNTKRNMIKLLVSSVTSDGEDITINFLGARKIKESTFQTCRTQCECRALRDTNNR